MSLFLFLHPTFRLTKLKHYIALLKIFIREEWIEDCAENKKPSAMGFYTPLKGPLLGKTIRLPFFLSRYSVLCTASAFPVDDSGYLEAGASDDIKSLAHV